MRSCLSFFASPRRPAGGTPLLAKEKGWSRADIATGSLPPWLYAAGRRGPPYPHLSVSPAGRAVRPLSRGRGGRGVRFQSITSASGAIFPRLRCGAGRRGRCIPKEPTAVACCVKGISFRNKIKFPDRRPSAYISGCVHPRRLHALPDGVCAWVRSAIVATPS